MNCPCLSDNMLRIPNPAFSNQNSHFDRYSTATYLRKRESSPGSLYKRLFIALLPSMGVVQSFRTCQTGFHYFNTMLYTSNALPFRYEVVARPSMGEQFHTSFLTATTSRLADPASTCAFRISIIALRTKQIFCHVVNYEKSPLVS